VQHGVMAPGIEPKNHAASRRLRCRPDRWCRRQVRLHRTDYQAVKEMLPKEVNRFAPPAKL
jgi:hypothetical protein